MSNAKIPHRDARGRAKDAGHLHPAHSEEFHYSSDDDSQHPLEVVFNGENMHRRKSSLVASDPQLYRRTACFVHALLDDQHDDEHHHNRHLDGIAETTPPNQPHEPKQEGDEEVVEPKLVPPQVELHEPSPTPPTASPPPGTQTPGQPDEQLWKTTQSRPSVCENIAVDAKRADTKAVDVSADAVSHSRLLTKKQLSDMAWGVRELSKRLGSVNLKLKVKNVFILTKAHDESLVGNTREVAKWLLSKDRGVEYVVYVEDLLKGNKNFGADTLGEELNEADGKTAPKPSRLRYWTEEMCRSRPQTFDFIVTLGGDGTVLYASWLFQRIVPPVLSFALGSLGFLTKFDFDDFQGTLTTAFRDGIKVSLRLRFEVTVMRCQKRKKRLIQHDGDDTTEVVAADEDWDEDLSHRDLVEELVGEEKDDERTHRPDGTYEILNDIVVDRGPNPTMSSVELFGDDEHLTSIQADGVCVATPTGSTAYNLAAGGSLCHPENPVILLTAICAHTLSFRPIILPDTIVLRVGVPFDARTTSWASFDGRERVELRAGDYVTVSASRYPFANVMPSGRRSEDWINSIRAKLGWNTRTRQKAFDKKPSSLDKK
ncbi:hypothetical protein VE01_01916 [Pseudogymnoascus verrucosus]|uniref:NAD(+) kinase n=1 Tax=Pseudogymnoascus verrucosus TaxID=342668 RepID=A0A1B8GWE2_9PEZI|nr:uncharacterized protein VE01_01916 [Pseudogymnoascus verrucosus]OBU00154.1 hypothetical protein VE01_01916 [Pseudogymnoascus verrucosus]